MIFVTGPLYSGKRAYLRSLGWTEEACKNRAIFDVQNLAGQTDNLEALADRLSAYDAVVATEVGGGVIPIDPVQRREREAAGRLACLLAQRAERVVRVVCGLPQVLKGETQ